MSIVTMTGNLRRYSARQEKFRALHARFTRSLTCIGINP